MNCVSHQALDQPESSVWHAYLPFGGGFYPKLLTVPWPYIENKRHPCGCGTPKPGSVCQWFFESLLKIRKLAELRVDLMSR